MSKGWGKTALVAAVSVWTLTGCDDLGLKFPGFGNSSEREDSGGQTPPPVDPVDGDTVDGSPDPDTGGSDTDGSGGTDTGPDGGAGTGTEQPTEPTDTSLTDTETTDPVTPDPSGSGGDDVTPVDPDTTDTSGSVTPPVDPEPPVSVVPTFTFRPAGVLQPGTGEGALDNSVFAPEMVFPIKDAPAFPQSQVFRPGGQVAGDQCQADNYIGPWIDNFCETRTSDFSTPFCTEQGVHLGQDIRVGTPEGCRQLRSTAASARALYPVVAVEDGTISNVGRYTVNLRSGGRIYRYLHLNMQKLEVAFGDEVKAGDVIGYVSNDFGGAATTFHLHFEIKMNTAEHGWTFVPPYPSLVKAYALREGGPGKEVPFDADPTANVASAPNPE